MIVMGVDGGGSHARVALTESDLVVLGQGESGGVNPNVQTPQLAEAHLREAMQQALTAAQIAPEQVSAVCLGIAGTSALADSANWLRRVVTDVLPRARVIVSSDAEIALVGAFGAPQGVIVIAGTGSVAYGINHQGQHARAGGYGYLLGDEGSGYWLGKEALAAIARAYYEQATPTRLTERVLAQVGLTEPEQLVEWVYARDAPRNTTIAGLAPLILHCASEGDAVASEIVQRGALGLSLLVKNILQQLADPSLPIAFSGSVLTQSPVMSRRLCEHLGLDAIPTPRYPPVLGAVLLGFMR